MYKMFKFGVSAGVLALLTACGSSEHFMQDDVYNTRTPIMPPGTDLNDVTDYATFVVKKEQETQPERTTYVSPREYRDYFYYSQYYFYGYSPYSTLTGISYYGYGNFHYPPGYGVGYGSTFFYPSMNGAYWPNSMGFGNAYYGNGYYPYGMYYNNPYYNPYPYYYSGNYYSGNNSWYHTPAGKPKTVNNLSGAHAGTRRSMEAPIGYPTKMAPNSGANGRTGGIVTNTSGARSVNAASPVVNRGPRSTTPTVNRVERVESVRPASSGRSNTGVQRTDGYQRSTVNQSTGTRETRPTFNNSTPERSSSPTMRSSGGSSGGGGGAAPSSGGAGGGSRSGGRR